ncbi:MAG TPA: DUF456 family protein, partial [Terriglobales bacterium]|nr:DUF456 family protein [Terriglobales bacterium]
MNSVLVLWIIAVLLVTAGLIGLVFPAMPGAPLIFAGLLLAAWAEGFKYVGLGTMMVNGVIALLTMGVDLWASMFGARRFGASKYAVVGALVGTIIGLFIGFPGVIFGPFIGAVIGELIARKDLWQASRAGIGATLGIVLGAALKLALAFTMVGIFIVARLF